ncbi:MAG: UDP-N-acetylmuramoyl-tripeptide--D-alanyl-D-alanine ligase [Ruminococcaceae bacterium]|nr:UDP-N-acetylmuramoyl-tripeptide--D-alanyl-D-alanine ligase [Oscillospiraceae bacterium]
MRISLTTPMQEVGTLSAALGSIPVAIGTPPVKISGIATHTKELQAGDLFVALSGARYSGNDFVAEALSRGAVAVLTEQELPPLGGNYWVLRVKNIERALLLAAGMRRRLTKARVVAVSGSTGKTTVKEIIASLLLKAGTVRKSEGNFNSTVGMPLSLLQMEDADYFVLEVGINHAGEMEPLAKMLAPELAVLTNVGSAHIGHFADAKELLQEKLKLSVGQRGEDIFLLADSIPHDACLGVHSRMMRVGAGEGADFQLKNIINGKKGVCADLWHGERSITGLKWHIPGSIGMSCLAIGGAVGILFGLSDEAVRSGLLQAAQHSPRMKMLQIAGMHVIDDTYNASPEAMVTALETLAYLSKGACAAVLGDMGELGMLADTLHDAVGECAAHSGISELFTYGNYSEVMAKGALRGGMPPQRVHAFPFGGEQELVAELLRVVPRGATVLFKASRKTALERVIEALGREL